MTRNTFLHISDFIYIYFSSIVFSRKLFPDSYFTNDEVVFKFECQDSNVEKDDILLIKRLKKGCSFNSDVFINWIETAEILARQNNLNSVILCLYLDPTNSSDIQEVYQLSLRSFGL